MYLIIGKDNCPACEAAKAKLKSKGIPYVYKSITSGDAIEDNIYTKLLIQDFEVRTVPLIFEAVGGYDILEKKLNG